MKKSWLFTDLEVYPVFSLDSVVECLGSDVLLCKDQIDELLKDMESRKKWPRVFLSISTIPSTTAGKAKKKNGAYPIESLIEHYSKHGKLGASTPYLIGCILMYLPELRRAYNELQTIEVIEEIGGCEFKPTKPFRSSILRQLCIKRAKDGAFQIVFSTYIQDRNIRSDGREGDGGVTFFTVPIAVENTWIDLSIKMIGKSLT